MQEIKTDSGKYFCRKTQRTQITKATLEVEEGG